MPPHSEWIVKLKFDVTAKTAEIEYWEDEETYISSWTYDHDTDTVHAPEKTDTYDVDYAEVLRARAETRIWQNFITNNFKPPIYPRSKWGHDLRKKLTKVTSSIRIGGVQINDDEWNEGTNLVTYNPRPEISWSWADYILWRQLRREFHDAIFTFGKGE